MFPGLTRTLHEPGHVPLSDSAEHQTGHRGVLLEHEKPPPGVQFLYSFIRGPQTPFKCGLAGGFLVGVGGEPVKRSLMIFPRDLQSLLVGFLQPGQMELVGDSSGAAA